MDLMQIHARHIATSEIMDLIGLVITLGVSCGVVIDLIGTLFSLW